MGSHSDGTNRSGGPNFSTQQPETSLLILSLGINTIWSVANTLWVVSMDQKHYTTYMSLGAGYCSQYSNSLWLEQSRNQILVGAQFAAPSQPPVQWVPGLFTRGKVAGAWHWQTQLAPKLKNEESHISTPLMGLHGLFQDKFYLYLFHEKSNNWNILIMFPQHNLRDLC